METSEFCVYTILHREKLASAATSGKPVSFTEKTNWSAAESLLDQAKCDKRRMLILFADAADTSELIYWGFLTKIDRREGSTEYGVERILPLKGKHTPQDLVLRSENRPIKPNYIRPYAICYTPAFMEHER